MCAHFSEHGMARGTQGLFKKENQKDKGWTGLIVNVQSFGFLSV